MAERAVATAQRKGSWLLLQNVHLVPRWLPRLSQLLSSSPGRPVHSDFRLFLVAETPHEDTPPFPRALLRMSTCIAHEASTGMVDSLSSALTECGIGLAGASDAESPARPTRRAALHGDTAVPLDAPPRLRFALAWFHACLMGRRLLGNHVSTHEPHPVFHDAHPFAPCCSFHRASLSSIRSARMTSPRHWTC